MGLFFFVFDSKLFFSFFFFQRSVSSEGVFHQISKNPLNPPSFLYDAFMKFVTVHSLD